MLRTGAKGRKLLVWWRRESDHASMTRNDAICSSIPGDITGNPRPSKGLQWPGGRGSGGRADDAASAQNAIESAPEARQAVSKTSFILHKPRGTVCSNGEPAHLASQRQDVYDLIKSKGFPAVGCVGRLDLETSGILVFTDDSRLNMALTCKKYALTHGAGEATPKTCATRSLEQGALECTRGRSRFVVCAAGTYSS